MGIPAAAARAPASPDRTSTDVGARAASRRGPSPAQIALGLTLVAGALRFATINVQSIWLDESATMILVHRGFSGMLSHLSSSESTPPLYYVLVWAWTKVFGAGPIGFRSFSALAGTLTIPVLYLAGRQISQRTGLWAAALAAVNPAMYYYSQEARCYALLVLFCAVAFVLWQRALRLGDGRSLALWGAMSGIALLTHYFAAFLFLPEAVILVRRLGWRRLRAPIAGVVLVGIALLPLAYSQRSDGKASWIEESSLSSRVAETAKQFLVGLYGPLEIETALVSGLLALGAIALLIRRGDTHERSAGRDAAIVAVAGLAIPLALAVTHALDIFDGRNVIATWTPYAVLLAVGLGTRRAGRGGIALGAGLCAVSIAVIAATNALSGYQRDDWRGVARALPASTGARVIVGEHFALSPLSIYLDRLRAAPDTVLRTRELDFAVLRVRQTKGSPIAPSAPTTPPPGFRLAGVEHTEAFAVSRFLAPRPTAVSARSLLRLSGDPAGEVLLQG